RLLAGGHVGVEVPVPLLGSGIPPADREIRHSRRDGVLDQAPARRDVLDVELVDLRRDGDERPRARRLGARRLLDQLVHPRPYPSARCTTWPGLTARFPPTENGRRSTADGIPRFCRTSLAK